MFHTCPGGKTDESERVSERVGPQSGQGRCRRAGGQEQWREWQAGAVRGQLGAGAP